MTTSLRFKALEAAYQLHFYLLFKTRYLRPLLGGNDEQGLIATVLDGVCVRDQYHVLDTSITPKHLRLLVSLKPEQTISGVVKTMKGNLSHQFGISVFDEVIAPRLFSYLIRVGRKHGFALDRMGLLPDHIHLILEALPSVSIQECVLAILNNTHQWMEKHYWGVLKQTGAWDVWEPSFYAGTVGEFSTAQIRQFLSES
jgi:REP element-mobilizing transposase RayT